MAKIDDLMKQVADARLRRELETAVAELKKRTRFGLVYENHLPEMTALPGLPITEGAFVVNRAQVSGRHAFRVCEIRDGQALVEPLAGGQTQSVPIAELIASQRFGEPIYPGLELVGTVERGGPERAHHAVINGENYFVLKTLTWTHRGKVDAIYIDPPYNTGARDWKYNNDYVESDDAYRHSKWLAMMERRLRVAKELLNPANSVLIVTIDEKEYLRLGLLLNQVFPEARIQMISSVIAQKGVSRGQQFYRTDEYIFFVAIGSAAVQKLSLSEQWQLGKSSSAAATGVVWSQLRRSGTNSSRVDRPSLFYPIFIDPSGPRLHSTGPSPALGASYSDVVAPEGTIAVWPNRSNSVEGNWQQSQSALMALVLNGYVKVGRRNENGYPLSYLKRGSIEKIASGSVQVTGRDPVDGHVLIDASEYEHEFIPGSQWNIASHDATYHGTQLLSQFLPARRFPFPKSVYAVEDALRFFVANKPEAVILDFFAGSGTTAHAVMRLNKQDGGRRQCISVTNNEIGADEAKALREKGLCPGDAEWERWGICDYITRPRIEAAITGKTPDGQPIQGDYKFTDEFPMADGFAENVSFFRLNYLDPDRVDMGQQFAAIAPLLWLQSGAVGAWDTSDAAKRKPGFWLPAGARYGVCFRDSAFGGFCEALHDRPDVTHAYIVTNSEDAYTQMRAALPPRLVIHRLYRDYLRSFRLKPAS